MVASKTYPSSPCRADMQPPLCCQPSMSDAEWDERTARIEAALVESLAGQPQRCGQCGSDDICPMFDPDMLLWQCSACGDVFAERD